MQFQEITRVSTPIFNIPFVISVFSSLSLVSYYSTRGFFVFLVRNYDDSMICVYCTNEHSPLTPLNGGAGGVPNKEQHICVGLPGEMSDDIILVNIYDGIVRKN